MDSDVIARHGLGTAPLGGLYTEVTDRDASDTLRAALDAGIRYFDTAPLYGHGLAELRLGSALRSSGLARSAYQVSTKVGRVLVPGADPHTAFRGVPPVRPQFDFSADGVRRSIEESLDRLSLDHIDLALVHDPDQHEAETLSSAFPTLMKLRDEGIIRAIGVGMNQVEMLTRFAAKANDIGLEYALVAGRWTLLDRSAGAEHGLLDTCHTRGVAVIVGGVFNSGVLANPSDTATFDYSPVAPHVLQTALQMARVCESFGVDLTSAALQFPWRHEGVSSVIVGARSVGEVQANHRRTGTDAAVPEALWAALDAVLRGDVR